MFNYDHIENTCMYIVGIYNVLQFAVSCIHKRNHFSQTFQELSDIWISLGTYTTDV